MRRLALALVPAAALFALPVHAQDPEETVLDQDTAPLDNPSHLDLQRSLVAWMACTDVEPDDVQLERVQRRLLSTAPAETMEAAVAALEEAARDMAAVIRDEGCDGQRVQRSLALFDVYLQPALEP